MKTFSRVAIAILTMVGTAGAQAGGGGVKPPDAKPPSTPPAPPAPAPKPAGATPGPAPAPAAKPAAATEKAVMPAPPPEPPLPPEIAEMAKTSVGTWKCKGDEWDDRGNKSPITATNKVKLELDNWWISETLEVKGQRTVKTMAYSTYDKLSRKWRRVVVMNRGAQMIGTSDGPKEGKLTWSMDLISPMGAGLFRDYLDASDPKVGLKVRGELSLDKGKSWLRAYELVCTK